MPNALDSEKFPPAEDNVIRGNEIFWNNFNFHAGAPFKPKESGVVPLVPIGTGLLLLGGRRNTVEDNKIFGNYAVGVGGDRGLPARRRTRRRARWSATSCATTTFGLGGTDRNGRELAYDGNGSGNCFGPNTGVSVTIPADGSTFAPCPFAGANAFDRDAQIQMIGLAGPAAVDAWIKHPHASRPGYAPLEVFEP